MYQFIVQFHCIQPVAYRPKAAVKFCSAHSLGPTMHYIIIYIVFDLYLRQSSAGQIKAHVALKRGALTQHPRHFVLTGMISYAGCAE